MIYLVILETIRIHTGLVSKQIYGAFHDEMEAKEFAIILQKETDRNSLTKMIEKHGLRDDDHKLLFKQLMWLRSEQSEEKRHVYEFKIAPIELSSMHLEESKKDYSLRERLTKNAGILND